MKTGTIQRPPNPIYEAAAKFGGWQGLPVKTPDGTQGVIRKVKDGKAKVRRVHKGMLQEAWIPLENLTA